MKLKAPQGVGDPCIAGVTVPSRDGIYDVEAKIGARLIEWFGFVAVEAAAGKKAKRLPAARRAGRRGGSPERKEG